MSKTNSDPGSVHANDPPSIRVRLDTPDSQNMPRDDIRQLDLWESITLAEALIKSVELDAHTAYMGTKVRSAMENASSILDLVEKYVSLVGSGESKAASARNLQERLGDLSRQLNGLWLESWRASIYMQDPVSFNEAKRIVRACEQSLDDPPSFSSARFQVDLSRRATRLLSELNEDKTQTAKGSTRVSKTSLSLRKIVVGLVAGQALKLGSEWMSRPTDTTGAMTLPPCTVVPHGVQTVCTSLQDAHIDNSRQSPFVLTHPYSELASGFPASEGTAEGRHVDAYLKEELVAHQAED